MRKFAILLTARQAMAVNLRLQRKTFREIALALGNVSQERARQIYATALRKIPLVVLAVTLCCGCVSSPLLCTPSLGVSAQEVRAAWGKPCAVLTTVTNSVRVEEWDYPGGQLILHATSGEIVPSYRLYFQDGKLTSFQKEQR